MNKLGTAEVDALQVNLALLLEGVLDLRALAAAEDEARMVARLDMRQGGAFGISWANGEAERIFRGEVAGRRDSELIQPPQLHAHREGIRRWIAGDALGGYYGVWNRRELLAQDGSGEILPVEIRVSGPWFENDRAGMARFVISAREA